MEELHGFGLELGQGLGLAGCGQKRSHPHRVCLGRECSTSAYWRRRGWAGPGLGRAIPFSILFFFPYFFSSLWFSRLQIKHSDSCLWEERRSSVGIVVDRHGVKNIIAAGKSPVKQRCSQSKWDFLGSWIRGFFFFFSLPCVLLHEELGF